SLRAGPPFGVCGPALHHADCGRQILGIAAPGLEALLLCACRRVLGIHLHRHWRARSAHRRGLQQAPRFCTDHHTVEQYLQLWRWHNDDVITNGTPPPAERILPVAGSFWNHVMGGVDTVRKTLAGRARRTARL
ncbi:Hypothetical Protein FCC1311_114462, partial [Hondaea fermentalgiana]